MNKDQPNVPYVSCVALGYVRDPIPNLYKVCRNEGFPGLENNYVTWLWVWLDFKARGTCVKFKQNEEMKVYLQN